MRLIDAAGHGVDLRVTGYQFPDAEDLAQRHSWHMVEGTATSPEGSWTFRYPALTCDDSQYVARWLRTTALRESSWPNTEAAPTVPASLAFTEPNLTMAASDYAPDLVTLDIGLDLEFSPPWRHRDRAGTPFVIRTRLTHQQLERAADDWEQEIAPYPNH
ncbi:hypothetical protein [Krasilnikovia sp. MM14-A1259]|uniref:WapI family immunity protein n=1 Tax=Krasilnikovia sp. MM14-A1259 TaxID=3373539 RepID=UPI0037F75547